MRESIQRHRGKGQLEEGPGDDVTASGDAAAANDQDQLESAKAALDPATSSTPMSAPLGPRELFELMFAPYPHRVARDASRRERKAYEYVSMSLVYGEIAFGPFQTVIEQLKRWYHILEKPGGVFLDIGSGCGKAVFAATLVHDFDACHGIEILEGLHGIAVDVLGQWDRVIKKQHSMSLAKRRTRIQFTQGDALDVEWPANPDLVFLNSTCFTPRFLRDLTKKLNTNCKAGTIVITATHELPDGQNFELLRSMTVQQEAWGDATWYIQRKRRD